MRLCSDALYHTVASDLASELPTLPAGVLFDRNAEKLPWPGISPREVACLALLNSLLKKNYDEIESTANQAALEKFQACNEKCLNYSLDTAHLTELDVVTLGEFDKVIHDSVEPAAGASDLFCIERILENLDVGPGAAVGASGYSFYHKIANGPMTASDDRLYQYYIWFISHFGLEKETEIHRLNQWGKCKVATASKLGFARKNSKISRITCTEPSLNMLFQKGLSANIEIVLLRSFGIDLAVQPGLNAEMARVGSLTGEFGTADLVSASDTISLRMARERLPGKLLRYLLMFRSPFTELPGGSRMELHMLSSMGNGSTFSLQTLLFASVCKAVYNARGIPFIKPCNGRPGNFGVFGDDIIVVKDAYNHVCRTLSLLGFEVNFEKSFNTGPFRESCGADFWSGRNVRGIYAKTIRTPQKRYTLFNRLSIWAANQDVALPATLRLISGSVYFVPIPPWENEDAGLQVPYSVALANAGVSYKPLYSDLNRSLLYHKYSAIGSFVNLSHVMDRPFILKKSRIKEKRKECRHNHAGILLAAVNGNLRDGCIGIRSNTQPPRYTLRTAVAPCWDWHSSRHSWLTGDGWTRWLNSEWCCLMLDTA